jgi:hypothetical protein
MIKNIEEIKIFLESISCNNTVIFTNGNSSYIDTLIYNLLKSYDRFNNNYKIGVICSDEEAFEKSKKLNMTSEIIYIPELKIDNAYSSNAGEEFYLRLCFVKIIVINLAINLGYDVLYIDPDMTFNLNCIDELINIKDELTFAKYINNSKPFLNSNIMRVFPTEMNKIIFDFNIDRDLNNNYLLKLPDVGDETFLTDNIFKNNFMNKIKSLNISQYPAGGDSKYLNHKNIKMFHANCFVGLKNKITYLKLNNNWYI